MAVIGHINTLPVLKSTPQGFYLFGAELGEILLPGRDAPKQAVVGETIDVFIYLDSEDRLIATTKFPTATVGEFGAFKVLSVNERVGAFLDWGLPKDLLLPFREQERPVRPGETVIAAVTLDQRSSRIIASTYLDRHLSPRQPNYRVGQPVNLLIAGKTPLGFNAIIENSHRGLLFHDRVSVPLHPGQKVRGFIQAVRPDGKIDLSLDPSGYKRVLSLKENVVAALEDAGGKLNLDDDSPPELIRQKFGASKKAFKQALGALYKQRRIQFTNPGIQLIDNAEWSPGEKR